MGRWGNQYQSLAEFILHCEPQAENSGMRATWLAFQSVQVGLLAQSGLREHNGSDPALDEGCLGVKLGITARFVHFFWSQGEDSEVPRASGQKQVLLLNLWEMGVSTYLRKLAPKGLLVATRGRQEPDQWYGAGQQRDVILPLAVNSLHQPC